MPLDPLLENYIASRKDEARMYQMTPQEARASKADARMKTWPRAAEVTTQDIAIPMDWGDCNARLYRPSNETLPLVIYYHGGGFMICDIETHDGVCRSISGSANVAVLSVDYRLAPEHPYPAGQNDATDAVRWAIANKSTLNFDPAQIILAGDSAGGNLAAVAALRLVGEIDILGQALLYPATDYADQHYASRDTFANGYGLTKGDGDFFWDNYLSGDEKRPREIAIVERDDLGNSPATFVGTAEYDPIRDEAEIYAARLVAHGVPTFARRYLGANHNFLAFAGLIAACDEIYTDLSRWIGSITGETK
jgi:acetyl esterase